MPQVVALRPLYDDASIEEKQRRRSTFMQQPDVLACRSPGKFHRARRR